MYFSRTGNLTDLLIWSMMSMGWCIGGWLIVKSCFPLRRRERIFTGMALGLIFFMVLTNMLGHVLELKLAYWVAAVSILVIGLGTMICSQTGLHLNIKNDVLPALIQIACFAGVFYLYALINRGLAIFDDFYNLPLVSRLAAGDFPPHYFLYPDKPMPFHYGLHLIAASLVSIGGLFPWSAFDISKALSIALLIILAWLWFRRYTHSRLAAFGGCALVLFGSGTRWLLRLLPHNIILRGAAHIQLIGSGADSGVDLLSAIHSPWNISGAGSLPFPFAFANGLFPPATMALSSTGAMPLMTLILLLLLGFRQKKLFPTLMVSIVLASFALTGEHYFVTLWIGMALAVMISWWNRRRKRGDSENRSISYQIVLLGLAVCLAIPFGGVLTEMVRRSLPVLSGGTFESGFGLYGFTLRWPPALVSAHLGVLSFFSPFQLLVILLEVGPVIFLAPVVMLAYFRKARHDSVLSVGMTIAALIAFLGACLLQYQEREREMTRLVTLALSIWMVLGYPLIWRLFKKGKLYRQLLVGAGYLITLVSGLVLFSIECNAAGHPQLSDFITNADALIAQQYWNKLPDEAQILDRIPYRAITIFGRTGGNAYLDNYTPTPEWQVLITHFDPVKVAQMGYQYIYFDNIWRRKLSSIEKETLAKSCVKRIEKIEGEGLETRMILDIQDCLPK